jgi:Xaa-Pro dipeptidase
MSVALPERLRPLLAQEYPHASDAEMTRRRGLMQKLMEDNQVDHLVFYGANRTGSAVQWLTHWPVTTEAACVFTPGRRDALYIHYYNHLALARRIAPQADIHWGGENTAANVVAELEQRGASRDRVGVIGPLGLRRVKSSEELDWFELGAWLSDLGMAALRDHARPGVSERELANHIERAYVGEGGTTVIHFIGATPMGNPSVPAPAQFCSTRKLEKGDIVFAEISAAFWDHSGQVLRSFAVGEAPNALFMDLHSIADAAFDAMAAVLRPGAKPADVLAASSLIEDAGFTTIDDILHGYGGGYFPPVLGSQSRSNGKIPEEPLVAGQLVVIQPNVVTLDGKAGVQTGEMVLITDNGIKRMHSLPRGFPTL